MGIVFTSRGSFDNTEKFLRKMQEQTIFSILDKYGQAGVQALREATPIGEGVTAGAWTYEVIKNSKECSIIWSNTHVEDGRPIAILLQLGHGTRTGGYVQGRDYINPALKPIFDKMANDVWEAVKRA